MRTVYKYPLNPGMNTVQMPKGATLLAVGAQRDEAGRDSIVLWALVDPANLDVESRVIVAANTGRKIEDENCRNYVGSVVVSSATPEKQSIGVIWHVFSAA